MTLFGRWKLVDDWRDAHKWYTVHFSLYGITFNGICAAIVKGAGIAVAFIGVLPLRYVFLTALAFSLLTLCGRFVCQQPKPPAKPTGPDATL